MPRRSAGTRFLPTFRLAVSLAAALFFPAGSAHAGDLPGQGASCLGAGTYDREITVANRVHRYRLYVPPSAVGPAALVLQFHGGGGSGALMELTSRWSQLAAEEGFLVVTPEGWAIPVSGEQVWNAGDCCGPIQLAPDHVAATAAILDDVAALGACFDPARVYASGHSNGGMMSYRLACQLSERIAAIAVSAGALVNRDLEAEPPIEIFPCTPTRPVSVLHVHGLIDECVRYEGGASNLSGLVFPPVEDSLTTWRGLDGCGEGSDVTTGDIRRRSWACAAGSRVELVTVSPLGHAWAGSDFYNGEETCGGTTYDGLSTTAEAWRFFSSLEPLFDDGFESGDVGAWPLAEP